ncbi:MAG TPA: hypothetical protein V6C65_11160 [Allocoleopsis sp.]
MMSLKLMQYTIATVLTGIGLLVADAAFSPVRAAQQFFCTGQMSNGWNYTAEFVDGRFTQIRWQRSGQPPQVSTLTFSSTNAQGQPIYRGAFQGATAVTLIDISKGAVGSGSEISVGVEEWGWSRGICGTSASGGGNSSSDSVATVRQNIVNTNAEPARVWLRQNNFSFTQTMEHTDAYVIERWNRNMTEVIDVRIVNGVVSDVVAVR